MRTRRRWPPPPGRRPSPGGTWRPRSTGSPICWPSTGKSSEAEAEFRKALAILQKLADDNPAVTQFRSDLAGSHNNLGWLLQQTGKSSEAEAEYRKALAIQQKLADDNPAVTEFRSDLAVSHNNLGNLLSDTGKSSEAEAEYRKALAIQQKLADDNPAVTDFRSRLAVSHNNLGNLLSSTGKSSEAEAEYRKALAIQQKLADDNPAVTEFRSYLATSHNNLGMLLSETGKPSEAEAEYRKALAIQQKLADDNPAVTQFPRVPGGQPRQPRHGCCRRRASRRRRRLSTARHWRSGRSSPTTTRKVPEYRSRLAWRTATPTSPTCSARSARLAEALDAYERAIAVREPLVQEHPKTTNYRSGLASDLPATRGQARRDMGDPAGAAADARRALALYDGLPSRSGEEWFEPACCHAALAGLAGRDRLGRVGRRGGGRGREGDGPAAPGGRDGLPQPRRLPDRIGPRPAPQPARLPAPDDGPGLPGRAVRPRRMRLSASAPPDRRTKRFPDRSHPTRSLKFSGCSLTAWGPRGQIL